jgi:hypothetical protein
MNSIKQEKKNISKKVWFFVINWGDMSSDYVT